MKRTHLIAVLIGLGAIAVLAADASAMYNPRMGRFMQRDPGPGGPRRPGAGGPAVRSGFAKRDPTGQYADGMNLHQYLRSKPADLVDPSGLASTESEIWCGSATLVVETDYCNAYEVAVVNKAVCRAYQMLKGAKGDLWNVQYEPLLETQALHDRAALLTTQQTEATTQEIKAAAGKARGALEDIIDELDDSDGTHYECEGRKGKCKDPSVSAWAHPHIGWTVHLCCGFFYKNGATMDWRGSKIIHELLHLYQQLPHHRKKDDDWNRGIYPLQGFVESRAGDGRSGK